ncbi:MAG: tryptophan--tRNA ligase [Alphaproteobacteria bacterium RIFCSPHIGHO2_12_FULL_45_9]|nr:MAG: tryptophan--tRNA ligase [Alphaproteobacteria bacterium RIFCSPHIGHO2_02_FULL_46_13]OFW95365.1 MAG: tryptophan--tRNA ligase [Alphaproteobacteria bacterium RIFCSPHIGHO2_12_FULL_45_9]
MKRILSGMQPTNRLQLGNYLGALRNWVDLQGNGNQCLYCVVDMHAITMPYDAAQLATSTREVTAAYLAAGVDPKHSSIFAQSAVGDLHAELMWYIATMTQIGKLDRMTQFKDKAGKNAEKAGLGLYAYPVLMAADILLYQATHVPVGEDQKQHLELTRDVAATFNHRYGKEFFTIPEPMIMGEATRVMSLRDGTQKMSKSAESDMSRINLTDTAEVIADKIKRAKTDPLPLPETVDGLKDRPEADNLITIYAALSGTTKAAVIAEFAGKQFSEFKPKLSDLTVAKIGPITEKMRHLLAEPKEIDVILEAGAEKARSIAAPTLKEVKQLMGFWKA